MIRRALSLFFLLLMLAPAATARVKTTEDLIAAMQKKHAQTWYRTLTFVQKSTTFNADGTSEAVIWYEALHAPGRLRVDIDPIASGNGFMYADGMQHSFKDGQLMSSKQRINPLLLLGFDIYFQPAAATIGHLKRMGYDTSKLREDTWQGNPVYVVGAESGETRAHQFWIDKKNLYFVRLLEPTGKNKESVQEIQFNKYEKVQGGGWVSPEVVVLVDGKRVFLEEYSEIRPNVKLDDKLFDPAHWTTARWR